MNLVPFSTLKVRSPWNDMQTAQQERRIQLPLSLGHREPVKPHQIVTKVLVVVFHAVYKTYQNKTDYRGFFKMRSFVCQAKDFTPMKTFTE